MTVYSHTLNEVLPNDKFKVIQIKIKIGKLSNIDLKNYR